MNFKAVSVITLLFLCSLASADIERGIFITTPKCSNTANTYSSIIKALHMRRWTIESEENQAVTASINHRDIDAKITISHNDNHFTYECWGTRIKTSLRYGGASTGGRKTYQTSYCPHRWVENLQSDTRHLLAQKIKSQHKDTERNPDTTADENSISAY